MQARADGRGVDFEPSTPRDMSDELLHELFMRYDVNESGNMDTFELASAVGEALGHVPTTAQVTAMVEAAGAEHGTLTLNQFSFLVRSFNLEDDVVVEETIEQHMAPTYEVEFRDSKLGFHVKNYPARGVVVVSRVDNPELEGVIGVHDTVHAVNGAPLGFVTDSRYLQERISPLPRPVKITFERYLDVESIFQKFDLDASGGLDVFEFGHAVAEICGEELPSAQIAALLQASGAEGCSVSFDATYELSFPDDALGFEVKHLADQGWLLVARVVDTELRVAGLQVGDAVLAVNGAPLRFVTDPRVHARILFAGHFDHFNTCRCFLLRLACRDRPSRLAVNLPRL